MFRNYKRGPWWWYALLVVLVLSFWAYPFFLPHHHDGSCNAPCTVHFKKPMAEDNFKIDYRGDGSLRVWKVADNG